MKNPSRKSDLSAAQTALLTLLQRLNFGRIEHLHVRDGQPVFTPTPVIVREHKFGGDNAPRRELDRGDFLLKTPVVELFDAIAGLGTGVIPLIEIKHGLPFRMLLTEAAA